MKPFAEPVKEATRFGIDRFENEDRSASIDCMKFLFIDFVIVIHGDVHVHTLLLDLRLY